MSFQKCIVHTVLTNIYSSASIYYRPCVLLLTNKQQDGITHGRGANKQISLNVGKSFLRVQNGIKPSQVTSSSSEYASPPSCKTGKWIDRGTQHGTAKCMHSPLVASARMAADVRVGVKHHAFISSKGVRGCVHSLSMWKKHGS
mmetsp:Transcript_10108/g.16297  ORF Transcript_10108/g.16297 Transcript_10108/m.16297 type:complete len:144 (+) Transcript_10108:146-577(+)